MTPKHPKVFYSVHLYSDFKLSKTYEYIVAEIVFVIYAVILTIGKIERAF